MGVLRVASRLQQGVTANMHYAVQSGLVDYNPAQDMAGTIARGYRVIELRRNLNAYQSFYSVLIAILADR